MQFTWTSARSDACGRMVGLTGNYPEKGLVGDCGDLLEADLIAVASDTTPGLLARE